MKMKKRLFTATLASCLLACVTPVAWAKAEVTLKLGHIANEQHSWHKGSLKFAEEVAKAGYATEPTYAERLKGVIRTIERVVPEGGNK